MTCHSRDGWHWFMIICLFTTNRLRKWQCCSAWWKCRQIVPAGMDRDNPSQPRQRVTFYDRLSVHDGLVEYSYQCNRVQWKCRQIVTCDDSSQLRLMVTFCDHLSVCDGPRKIFIAVVGGGENFGKSSQSRWTRRPVTTRFPDSLSVCGGLMEVFMALLWTGVKMLADRPDWQGSWWPIITDGWWRFMTSCQFTSDNIHGSVEEGGWIVREPFFAPCHIWILTVQLLVEFD